MILFCSDPLNPRHVDAIYEREFDAASALGIPCHVISFEDLVAGSGAMALKQVPSVESLTMAIYRGWMLKPDQYQLLYETLRQRNIQLVNTPEMYRHCHHLPESYDVIADHTPESVWMRVDDQFHVGDVHEKLRTFGQQPIIVKDYVKSQKHYWHEACYIPNASDQNIVEKIVSRFLELQGDDLNEGLVFREFISFSPLANHAISDLPLTEEYRLFVMDSQLALDMPYWSEADYAGALPEVAQFADVMKAVNSRFYTMDIARQTDGGWMIVELGDGQVAGLPEHVDVAAFYQSLFAKFIN